MTRELIIEGQHVDLAPDTDITLEYVSNILSDPGKISLSHSYREGQGTTPASPADSLLLSISATASTSSVRPRPTW